MTEYLLTPYFYLPFIGIIIGAVIVANEARILAETRTANRRKSYVVAMTALSLAEATYLVIFFVELGWWGLAPSAGAILATVFLTTFIKTKVTSTTLVLATLLFVVCTSALVVYSPLLAYVGL